MKVSHLLAAVALLGMVSFAMAAKGDKGKGKGPKGLQGKVVSVDTTAKTVTIKTGGKKESKEVVVTTDDKTTITVDGNAATLENLEAGMMVAVTPATGTAEKIMAKTAKGKGDKGDKGKGKGKGKKKGDAE